VIKAMGDADVLRCLAKHLTYMPVRPGEYQADTRCDKRCIECGKYGLCVALREVLKRRTKVIISREAVL